MIRAIWGWRVHSGWTFGASSVVAMALFVSLLSPGRRASLAMLDDESSSSMSAAAKPSGKDFPLKAVATEMQALIIPDWQFTDPGKKIRLHLPPSFSGQEVGPRSPPV